MKNSLKLIALFCSLVWIICAFCACTAPNNSEAETTEEEFQDDISNTDGGTLTVRVGNVMASPGESIEVPVYFENNPGIFAAVLEPVYDTTRLNLTQIVLNPDLPGDVTYATKIVWLGEDADVDYNGVFFTLHFDVLADAPLGEATVSIKGAEDAICNYNEQDVHLTSTDGAVTVSESVPTMRIESTSSVAGNTVDVIVYLENNPGISACELAIEYDTSRLVLNDVTLASAEIPGHVDFDQSAAWASDGDDSTYNGAFLALTFTVLDDAKTGMADISLHYENGDISNQNQENVTFRLIEGSVHVYDPGMFE